MLSLTLPRRTWAHHIPVSIKLILLFVLSTVLFPVKDTVVLSCALTFASFLTVSLGRTAIKRTFGFVIALMWMAALLMAYHVYIDDIVGGLTIVCRILTLVLLANFVTMTTPLSDIMLVLEKLLWPFQRMGMNTRALAVAVGLVVRFTPVLILRASSLREAWLARSIRTASWRLVAPLGLSVLDDADRVSDALRARGGVSR